MTGAGFAGPGGPVSSGLFPRPAVRQASPGAPRLREGQRDHSRPTLGQTWSGRHHRLSAWRSIASCPGSGRSSRTSCAQRRQPPGGGPVSQQQVKVYLTSMTRFEDARCGKAVGPLVTRA
jgi:hypothetical protein